MAILAHELRIGNWVLNNGKCGRRMREGKAFYIKFSEDDWYSLVNGIFSLKDYEPIPLTPEILESCGFENESYGIVTSQYRYPKMIGNQSFLLNENIIEQFVFRIYDDLKKTDTVVTILTNLHQLQNLFFALTGEELKINLNVETVKG